MKQQITPQSKIKLDHLGQFYASVNCMENPCTFSITAWLKEPLVPETLQCAVNDLMRRLPFINVRLRRGFLWYYNQVLENPPQIIHANKVPSACEHFEDGSGHQIRFVYDERHFTVEVRHTVCDGRSLAVITSALLIRYFELLGVTVSKDGMIDCAGEMCGEEAEDAYFRYADLRNKYKSGKSKDVYMPKAKPAATRVLVRKIDLGQIKSKAKAHGVTISEYITAHIFSAFARQRAKEGCGKPITVNVPIDCRSFFPSKSMRNFVSNKTLVMAETSDFSEMACDIKTQFAEITADYALGKISEMEGMIRFGRWVPLFIKSVIIKKIGNGASEGNSTGFSNLGLMKLPEEIRDRVDMLSFALGPEPNMPYQFACMTVGDTLAFTATVMTEDTTLVDSIVDNL